MEKEKTLIEYQRVCLKSGRTYYSKVTDIDRSDCYAIFGEPAYKIILSKNRTVWIKTSEVECVETFYEEE